MIFIRNSKTCVANLPQSDWEQWPTNIMYTYIKITDKYH